VYTHLFPSQENVFVFFLLLAMVDGLMARGHLLKLSRNVG
jgi:hypothetical protein